MKSKNKYSKINYTLVKKVRDYAKYMKSFRCFAHDTLEDIEQELFCEIWPCLKQHEKSKSSFSYFADKVVKNRVVNLINRKQRMKYGGDIAFLDNETLDSLVDENCDFESKVAACSDVEDLIKQLPPHWQDLCNKLQVYNIAEVSEITGLSRTTIYKILKRISKKFPHLKIYIS